MVFILTGVYSVLEEYIKNININIRNLIPFALNNKVMDSHFSGENCEIICL